MSGLNRDEIIKSLVEAGIPEEEAKTMVIEKSEGSEEELEKSKKSEAAEAPASAKENDEEYSEEKEKELEKTMKEAEEAYKCYAGKKPVKKSETNEIEKSEEESDLMKSFSNVVGNLQKSIEDRFEGFEKSFEAFESFKEDLSLLKEEVDKIGKQTPQPKSIALNKEAVIEKAVDGGIQEGDKIHMSSKTHKNKIGELLTELYGESDGAIQKSIEADVMNFSGGFGSLSEQTKRLLSEKKNVVVH